MSEAYETCPSILQRVIANYVRHLAPMANEEQTNVPESALSAVHTFFADWYAITTIKQLTDDNAALIQQYAQLHEQVVY